MVTRRRRAPAPHLERWLLAGLLLMVLAAACGAPASRAPARSSTRPSARAADPAPARRRGAQGRVARPRVATSTTTTVVPCQPDDVAVSFVVQPRDGNQPTDRTRALVVVASSSTVPCTLHGIAGLSALSGATTERLAVRRVVPAGRPPVVVVQTGASGFAGVEWTSGPGCETITGFELDLPGQHVDLPVVLVDPAGAPPDIEVCAGSSEIGPFSATATGTLDFPAVASS